jgi:hypothetical protein
MFSDPLVAVMAVLMLFFVGMVVMILFLARSIAALREDFHDSMRKQHMYLSDVEQQLMQISFALRTLQEGGDAAKASPVQKPLGDTPLLRQEDPLLSMLEATARKKAASPGFEDQLLPPSSKGRPLMEEYGPANDPNLFDDAFLSFPGKKADRLKRGG